MEPIYIYIYECIIYFYIMDVIDSCFASGSYEYDEEEVLEFDETYEGVQYDFDATIGPVGSVNSSALQNTSILQ
jgi:hypothetical protein